VESRSKQDLEAILKKVRPGSSLQISRVETQQNEYKAVLLSEFPDVHRLLGGLFVVSCLQTSVLEGVLGSS